MINGALLNNRYKLNDIIGIGGMAYVYDAYDNILERDVAIKILKDDYSQTGDFLQKFKLEATSAASLNDENIVAIYDVGTDMINGKPIEYIVMEKIEGSTLKDVIENESPLSTNTIIEYARQIALALQCAHRKGLVHRDIKPGNILINNDNKAKVTDFGIARVSTQATITYTSSILGTVHYISPEQAKGQPIDNRSDLYSLGVVLYEMATGEVPFDAETPVSIAIKHIQDEPKDVDEINPEIDQNLALIIKKLLSKNLTDRYQTANELINDLDNYKHVVIPTAEKQTQRIQRGDIGAVKAEYTTKRKDFDKDKKRSKVVPILLFSLLFLALLGGVYSIISSYAKSREEQEIVQMPNVVGYTEENAISTLNDLGLKPVIKERKYDSAAPVGQVIEQSNKVNEKINKGSQVSLVVSRGAKTVQVPRLINFSKEIAEKDLEKLGLKIGSVTKQNDDKAKDIVISQYPDAYEEVAEGSKVDITISSGPKVVKVEVPNLSGQDENVAISTLSSRNLIPGAIDQKYSSQREGTIISQSIDAGEKVKEGTAIDLVVSKGPKPVEKPIENPEEKPEEKPKDPNNNGGDLGNGVIDEPKDPNTTDDTKPQDKKYVFNIKAPMDDAGKYKESFNVKIYNTVPSKQLLFEQSYTSKDLDNNIAVVEFTAPSDAKFQIFLDDKEAKVKYE